MKNDPKADYAIYQLKADPELHWQPVDGRNYNRVYAGTLPETASHDPSVILEDLYVQFNLCRPDDFHGHSLSVSDVVVLNHDGKEKAYYTDSYGFAPLPDFVPDNPLRNAEMALEDDYDMIDGCINNGPKHDAIQLPEQLVPHHHQQDSCFVIRKRGRFLKQTGNGFSFTVSEFKQEKSSLSENTR